MTDFDVDEFLAGLTPRTSEARVIRPRPELRERHADLEEQLKRAVQEDERLNREPEADRIGDELAALEEEIEAAEVHIFRFKSLGTRGWHDLLAQHPPSKEQRREFAQAEYNLDTFPAAAVAASSDSPKLTIAQARALESQLDLTEWNKLWAAVLDANLGGDGLPKSVLLGTLRALSGQSGTTASPEESPGPSSSDG